MTARNSQDLSTQNTPARPARGLLWTGWALSGLLAFVFLSGAIATLNKSAGGIAAAARLGYGAATLPVLAVLELVCAVLFLIPRTAVLGALLLTAYLGGAVASHVRIGDPQWIVPVVFGIVVWGALVMRRPFLLGLLFRH